MKKVLLYLAVLMPLIASSQERINRPKLKFESASEILTKATGWAYNETYGEWINYQNVISPDKDYKSKYKSMQGRVMMSEISQNFLSIQTKTVVFEDNKYYVVIVEKWDGEYEHPELELDWYTYKSTEGYIFTEKEYQKMKTMKKAARLKTPNRVRIGSKHEKYDEATFLDLIQTELSLKLTWMTYSFPVLKSDEGAMRFYVPDVFSDYNPFDFDKRYFETDMENFSRILLD